MKHAYTVTIAAAATILFTGSAHAQNQNPANQNYLSVISLKVAPDQEAAFTEFYKTGPGSKAIQDRIKANKESMRWTLLQAVYPGDPAPETNFMIASARGGAPTDPDPAKRDEQTRASTGMTYVQYMQKVRTMSRTVGQTLSHLHEATPGFALSEGDYVVVRRLKVSPGKTQEVSDLMRDVQYPLAADGVKAGRFKGWSFSHLSFPTGSSLPYDATAVWVHKDLASAVAGMGPNNGAAARFAEVLPGKNYSNYLDSLRENSKVVRTDLYRVVAAYRK